MQHMLQFLQNVVQSKIEILALGLGTAQSD
jgi:hypothetical protein